MNTTTLKRQKHQISLPCILRLLFLLMIFSSLSISLPNMGIAARVYRTGIDPHSQPFEVYDTSTDSWTLLGTIDTGVQLAVSADHKLYTYNRATDMIQVYDPVTNTWTDVLIGPGIVAGYGNLEVTNNGEFILTYGSFDSRVPDATKMYYTVGGIWNTFTLPEIFDFNIPVIPRNDASALGDYDHATGTLVVGKKSSEAVWKVDLSTSPFTVTIFSNGASFTGEIRRFGEIYNGHWYSQFFTKPITHYDLSDNSLPIIKETATFPSPPDPNISKYYSATVDHAKGIFYVNTFGTSGNRTFATWDPSNDTFNQLSPAPSAIPGGHSTIAFVNQSPVAVGTSNSPVEQGSLGGGQVTLDGTSSFDPDNDPIVSYTWTGPFGTATGATPMVTMPLGTSDVNLVVNDGRVDSAPNTVMVTVVDTTAPKVKAKLKKKKNGCVRVKFSATDICDTDPTVIALLNGVSVTNGQLVKLKHADGSSDDDSSGSCGDIMLVGHRFTLEVTATDDSGNVGTKSDTFVFPSKRHRGDHRKFKKKLKKLKKKWKKRYSRHNNSKGCRTWRKWSKWKKW